MNRDEIILEARRQVEAYADVGGLSEEAACVMAVAALTGTPLDPLDFDQAALLARAEVLVVEGLAASMALETARAELATWAERAQ